MLLLYLYIIFGEVGVSAMGDQYGCDNQHYIRVFVFGQSADCANDQSADCANDQSAVGELAGCVCVRLCELMDRSYGLYTWPAAPVLAQYVWSLRAGLGGLAVLELGAGTALPSLLAARLGATVTITDTRQVLANTVRSLQLNGAVPSHDGCLWQLGSASVRVMPLVWGHAAPELLQLPCQRLLLGADLIYDERLLEPLLWTVAFLLRRSCGQCARFVFSYQERGGERTLAPLLKRWRLRAHRLSLSEFGAEDSRLAGSDLPGNHTILLYEVTSEDSTV